MNSYNMIQSWSTETGFSGSNIGVEASMSCPPRYQLRPANVRDSITRIGQYAVIGHAQQDGPTLSPCVHVLILMEQVSFRDTLHLHEWRPTVVVKGGALK